MGRDEQERRVSEWFENQMKEEPGKTWVTKAEET